MRWSIFIKYLTRMNTSHPYEHLAYDLNKYITEAKSNKIKKF